MYGITETTVHVTYRELGQADTLRAMAGSPIGCRIPDLRVYILDGTGQPVPVYFLLEYRNQSISLQYSPKEEFTLPENLFIIGTMNTADRSIARIDTAMHAGSRSSS